MTKLRLTPLYWKSNIIRWDWLHCIENQTSDVEIDSSGERADRSNMRNQVGFNCPGFQFLRRILKVHMTRVWPWQKNTCSLRSLTRAKSFASPGPHFVDLRNVSTSGFQSYYQDLISDQKPILWPWHHDPSWWWLNLGYGSCWVEVCRAAAIGGRYLYTISSASALAWELCKPSWRNSHKAMDIGQWHVPKLL